MSQTINILDTSNIISEDVARHNENIATLRSSFSGTSFPDSPLDGQSCFRTDRGEDVDGGGKTGAVYYYSGNINAGESGWVLDLESSTIPATGTVASYVEP